MSKTWPFVLLLIVFTQVSIFMAPGNADTAGSETAESEPDIDSIEQSLLLKYLTDHSLFTLIDARSAEEFAANHIEGAINVPTSTEQSPDLQALPVDKGSPLVVYCSSGKRATMLSEELRDAGYRDVRVLPPRQIMFNDTIAVFNCGV
ncbi:MAG: rhodanese-like domain-containing protein [Pseudomonadales bacterium]